MPRPRHCLYKCVQHNISRKRISRKRTINLTHDGCKTTGRHVWQPFVVVDNATAAKGRNYSPVRIQWRRKKRRLVLTGLRLQFRPKYNHISGYLHGTVPPGHRKHFPFQSVIFARDSIYSAHMLSQFRPSVTWVDQSKAVEVRIMQFRPYSRPIPLVFAR